MGEEEGEGADGAKSSAPSGEIPTGEANGTAPTDASPALASEASDCGTKPKTITAMAISISSALPQAAQRSGYFALYTLTWAFFGPMSADSSRCLNLKKGAVKKLRASIAAGGTHLESGGAPKRLAAESKTKMGRAAGRKAKTAKLEDVELERKVVNLIEKTGHCVRSVSASLGYVATVGENRHAQQSEDRKIALLEKMIALYKGKATMTKWATWRCNTRGFLTQRLLECLLQWQLNSLRAAERPPNVRRERVIL